jgi:bifunctional NMN adenylyltransferase/nudix hydrolase
MMQVKQDVYDVGVIVGRFQVHDLHDGHIDLIQSVFEEHEKVIIFLGLSPVLNTQNNPLDFEARKQMILADFPEATVLYIKDMYDDHVWSATLDKQISDMLGPNHSAVLYGGRDSFLTLYDGKFPTRELKQEAYFSGSDVRNKLTKRVKSSPDFRHGVVWASGNRYPTVFTTVDVAIFRDDYTKILLGRKEHESQFRLIGGFSDVRDGRFEATAYREMQEETGLYHLAPADSMTYLGSFSIDDWRYRNEVDGIKTLLFACVPLGSPKPNDDIYELRWFDVAELQKPLREALDGGHNVTSSDGFRYESLVVPHHHETLARSLEYAKQIQAHIAHKAFGPVTTN